MSTQFAGWQCRHLKVTNLFLIQCTLKLCHFSFTCCQLGSYSVHLLVLISNLHLKAFDVWQFVQAPSNAHKKFGIHFALMVSLTHPDGTTDWAHHAAGSVVTCLLSCFSCLSSSAILPLTDDSLSDALPLADSAAVLQLRQRYTVIEPAQMNTQQAVNWLEEMQYTIFQYELHTSCWIV